MESLVFVMPKRKKGFGGLPFWFQLLVKVNQ